MAQAREHLDGRHLVVALLLLGTALFWIAMWRGCPAPKPGGRAGVEVPCTTTGTDDVHLESRRCRVEAHHPGHVVDWGGYVANRGPVTLTRLRLRITAFDEGGASLGSDDLAVIGSLPLEGWMYPGYGAVASNRSRTVYDRAPARLDIAVAHAERQRGFERSDIETTPADVQWQPALPDDVALDVQIHHCGGLLPGVQPTLGLPPFDCKLLVRNTGTRALTSLSLELRFFDGAGVQVSGLGLGGTLDGELRPGDAVSFTGGRGIPAHVRWSIHGRARAEAIRDPDRAQR